MFPNAKGSEQLSTLATFDPISKAAGTVATGRVSVANFAPSSPSSRPASSAPRPPSTPRSSRPPTLAPAPRIAAGVEFVANTPEQAAARLRRESAKWAVVVGRLGLRAD